MYVLWITFCQFRNLLKYQNQSVPYCEIKNNTILGGIWKCGRENKWKVPSFFSICRLQFSFRSRDCRRGSQKIKWLQDRSRNDVQLFRKCLVVHLSSFFLNLFLIIILLKHSENVYCGQELKEKSQSDDPWEGLEEILCDATLIESLFSLSLDQTFSIVTSNESH